MRLLIITLILIGSSTYSLAQKLETILINQEHLDKLIFTAIQDNPEIENLQAQLNTLEHQTKIVNSDHLGLFFVTGNLNEYSIQEISGTSTANNFYPRYNVGLSVQLDHFSKTKNSKKIIEENQKIVLGRSEIIERKLIADVTKTYFNYIAAKNILILKKKIEQFNLADFNTLETKFSEGDIELQEYSSARNNFYAYKLEIIQSEAEYIKIKNELETLVNRSLESLGIP